MGEAEAEPRVEYSGVLLGAGYAVVERLLDAGEVSLLRSAVAERLSSPQGWPCERPNNTLVPLRWNDAIVQHVLGSKERISRLVAVADAQDLRWISGYVSLREPHSPALWWHQDWWCWDHPVSFALRAAQVAVLCYLEGTDHRNAALRVLPGSHHRSTPLHAVLPEAHAEETGALASTHPAMGDQPGQVTLRLEAGDAAVIDYRLLHGTYANTTAARRHCVILTFPPSSRPLPADGRGHPIRHPALPAEQDRPRDRLLPSHEGPCRDLALNREAPPQFAIHR